MKLDIEALRLTVHAVNPTASVYRWATNEFVIRVEATDRLGDASIDVSHYPRMRPSVDCRSVKSLADRKLLRTVLDELDRQGFG